MSGPETALPETAHPAAPGLNRPFVIALLLAFGSNVALIAPIQNLLPRMIEQAAGAPGKALGLGIVTGIGALAAMAFNRCVVVINSGRRGTSPCGVPLPPRVAVLVLVSLRSAGRGVRLLLRALPGSCRGSGPPSPALPRGVLTGGTGALDWAPTGVTRPVAEVLRGVLVAVHYLPRGRAGQVLVHPVFSFEPARGALGKDVAVVDLAGGEPAVRDREGAAVLGDLVGQLRADLAEGGVGDGPAERLAAHALLHVGDVEVLDDHVPVGPGEADREGPGPPALQFSCP